MSIEAKIAAFEGGQLRLLEPDEGGKEVVLGLPLNRLLVKMIRVSAEEDPTEVATQALKAASPFPDEPLTVSCELVREDGNGRILIAAALPESSADDIGEALDAAKLNVVRIDSLAIGQLRGVWKTLGESAGRRIVLIRSVDCLSLVVLDGDQPSAIRAITSVSELRREMMLSLLEAEDFGGARKLEEIVVVGGEGDAEPLPEEALAVFAPVRSITVGENAALVGIQERSADGGTLNALPESWREVLEETRFKAKLVKYLAIAGGIWLLIVAVLFGVPMVYDFMTNRQKGFSKQQARQYAAVKEMKEKVNLIHKYSDHQRGALEIMKAISDRLPEGITLSGWTYRREDGLRVSGDADTSEAVYAFKDAMDELEVEDKEGKKEKLFPTVTLNGPNASKGGYRFDLDCAYAGEDEE